MSVPAPVTFTISEAINLAYNERHFDRTIWQCLAWIVPSVIFVSLLMGLVFNSIGEMGLPIVAGCVAGSCILLLQRLLLPRRAAKIFRESAHLQKPQTFSVTEEGFTIEHESGIWHSKWREIVKWDETPKFLAIYSNRIVAFLLPKAVVGEPMIDHVRGQLIASGLPKPGKIRR